MNGLLKNMYFIGFSAFTIGLLLGVSISNAYLNESSQASIFDTNIEENSNNSATQLNENDIKTSFNKHEIIKEIEITSLYKNTYLVNFFANISKKGNSLHPFKYIIVKEEDIITKTIEIQY